jgi:hypothetical protein
MISTSASSAGRNMKLDETRHGSHCYCASDFPHVYGRFAVSCYRLAFWIRPSGLLQFRIFIYKCESFADCSGRAA